MFCNKINEIIGKDITQLFGFKGIELRKSEIYYNQKKGVTCNYDNSTVDWPLGKLVLNNILSVSI
jgi:hypothetical protein